MQQTEKEALNSMFHTLEVRVHSDRNGFTAPPMYNHVIGGYHRQNICVWPGDTTYSYCGIFY